MTNEMKLLRAFIEASGYEIEVIELPLYDIKVMPAGTIYETTIDYKVTNKQSHQNYRNNNFWKKPKEKEKNQ